MVSGFVCHALDDVHLFWSGDLPAPLLEEEAMFAQLWALHPEEYHEIHMHGRRVRTPRWQQAYGADYHYTGNLNKARPMESLLQPFLDWAKEGIDTRLNGVLLNWYDGALDHYIGKHRDSTRNMQEGSPIVTISLGQERTFRMRPWKQKGFVDFAATHGKVFIIPYETNLAWTHEVPPSAKYKERRISITLRAFHI